MATDKELVRMSEQVYEPNGGTPPSGWSVRFRSVEFGINNSGYDGVVYRNDSSGELVFAHRGTELGKWVDVSSLIQDALNEGLPQFLDAEAFYDAVRTTLGGQFNVSVAHTGHSQGGGLANLIKVRRGQGQKGSGSQCFPRAHALMRLPQVA